MAGSFRRYQIGGTYSALGLFSGGLFPIGTLQHWYFSAVGILSISAICVVFHIGITMIQLKNLIYSSLPNSPPLAIIRNGVGIPSLVIITSTLNVTFHSGIFLTGFRESD